MRSRLFGSRRRKAAVSLSVMLVAVGSAWAAWTFMVNNGASVKTGTLTAPTVVPDASPAADLFPGSSSGLKITVSNPNATAMVLTTIDPVTLNPNGISVTPNQAGCPTSNFTVAYTLQSGLSIAIPPGSSNHTLPGQSVGMLASAPAACMGQTVSVGGIGTGWNFTFSN